MTTRKILIIEQCVFCYWASKDSQTCWHPKNKEGRQIPNKFSIPTWCELPDASNSNPALTILKAIINDATGDLNDLQKRTWPIRAENYRKAVKVIEKYKEKNGIEFKD